MNIEPSDTKSEPDEPQTPDRLEEAHASVLGQGKKGLYLAAAVTLLAVCAIAWLLLSSSDDTTSELSSDQQANLQEADGGAEVSRKFAIVDTNQTSCFNDQAEIACPAETDSYFGQDAQYRINPPSYTNNGDGTVSDDVTGLMWQQDLTGKLTYIEAVDEADSLSLAGYDDWRVPSIKELYSLIDFSGVDPDPMGLSTTGLVSFIDSDVFIFKYGDTSSGSRIIDSQWVTSNVYNSTVMSDQECFFGVNFADGRIKCYPTISSRNQGYFVRYVRGDDYGVSHLTSNNDGTVKDSATGKMWQQADSSSGLSWGDALSYCQSLELGGSSDWRLPNAKELHSIVDYSRSPDSTNSPAIDPAFETTSVLNEASQKDWPFFWTSTTHRGQAKTASAVNISFGRAMGNMPEFGGWIDVHGAGAQRSDQKSGDPVQFSEGRGPQGDAVRINNYARCVSDV